MALAAALAMGAEPLPVEQAGVAKVPQPASPHWVWVSDTNFWGPADGRSYLIDGDSGEVHGVLSAGYWHMQVHPAPRSARVYVAQTHYSRGTRGERTDVVVGYDAATLLPDFEVEIPPKRATFAPMPYGSALLDDERFLVVYNFQATQSYTVVDLEQRRVAHEGDAAGCVLIYPSGARRFNMLCGDGSMVTVSLRRNGRERSRARSAAFFDPQNDPVAEEGVRLGDTYYFVSFEGQVHPVDVSGEVAKGLAPWPLFTDAERAAGWRMGGGQLVAASAARGELYVLVHQGKEFSHKDPGQNVFVYDAANGARLREITLSSPATSILVTRDDEPRLVANGAPNTGIYVYDAVTGEQVQHVDQIGILPAILQAALP